MEQVIVIKQLIKLFLILVTILGVVFFLLRRIKSNKDDIGKILPPLDLSSDKRINERAEVHWQVILDTPNGIVHAKSKDISIGGAFILCDTPLPIDDQLKLTFEIPNYKKIGEINAEVVWSNINVPEDQVVNRGMGVKFVRNQHDVMKTLRNAITYHAWNTSEDPA